MKQRNVFPTDEIAHLWAHKTQSSARNSGRNFYFEDGTIYSYGSHFPIATWIENTKGEQAILFTTRSYYASKHISNVRRAIPSNVKVFYVKDAIKQPFTASHYDYYRRIMRESYDAAMQGSKAKRAERLREMYAARQNGQVLAKFFGKRESFPLPAKPAKLEAIWNQAIEDEARHNQAVEARRQAKESIRRAARQAAESERAKSLDERMENWRANKSRIKRTK